MAGDMGEPVRGDGRRTWWRRNRAGLLATAVLIPAASAGIGYSDWTSYASGRASQSISVAAGDVVTYAGADWGPITATYLDDPGLPADSRVIQASIRLDPGDVPQGCSQPTLSEADGRQRTWTLDWIPEIADSETDGPSSCLEDMRKAYELTLTYLVPADAEPPFVVEVYSADELPSGLRFALDLG